MHLCKKIVPKPVPHWLGQNFVSWYREGRQQSKKKKKIGKEVKNYKCDPYFGTGTRNINELAELISTNLKNVKFPINKVKAVKLTFIKASISPTAGINSGMKGLSLVSRSIFWGVYLKWQTM